jgi:hypothetical protein
VYKQKCTRPQAGGGTALCNSGGTALAGCRGTNRSVRAAGSEATHGIIRAVSVCRALALPLTAGDRARHHQLACPARRQSDLVLLSLARPTNLSSSRSADDFEPR